jgi:UDP-2,4-diacetamido-2,4,6-trideoxy-beta-L-altropyranose hydrolase
MINTIRERGFKVTALPVGVKGSQPHPSVDMPLPTHSDWLACDWHTDAEQTLRALEAIKPDMLVVDHYAIDFRWENVLRSVVPSIVVIDDLADRRHDCDFLLDQNWFGDDMARRYQGLIPDYCFTMLGPRYALLKPEYAMLRMHTPPRDGEVRRILVFMGGSDPMNETGKVIEALTHPDLMHLVVDVVVGPNHPDQLGIASKVEARYGTFVHRGLPSLAGLMMRADLMVGGGGATTWERMCLELPAVVICIADNQVEMNRALSSAGYIEMLDGKDNVNSTRIAEVVSALIKNREVLIAMSRSSRELVSGDGTGRVCNTLLRTAYDSSNLFAGHVSQLTAEAVQIRYACLDDAEMLFEWRNDIRTRRHFHNSALLSRAEHISWFSRTLTSERSELLIAMCGDDPVGCVRFDIDGEKAEVSIYLDPERHGRGWGSQVLNQAMKWIHSTHPRVIQFSADVLAENLASAKIFQRCGYSLIKNRFEFRRPKV